ncbi:hypothetical protein HOA55_05260 [archaeon]|nr:hypothetical protein [archaeon]MBT6820737.1 hypothetical protein [archaeon]MBT6955891.1 hypothetical protein [archaeon]MBT7239219.1 hypothetical protein [archaeon]
MSSKAILPKMTLNTSSSGIERDQPSDLLKKAEEFRRIFTDKEKQKREALAYFASLDEPAKRYIQHNNPYRWMHKASRMQM